MSVKDGVTYKVSGDGPEQFTAGVNVAREWQRKLPRASKFRWAISVTVVDPTQAAAMSDARAKTKDMFEGNRNGEKPRRGPKGAKPVRALEDRRAERAAKKDDESVKTE